MKPEQSLSPMRGCLSRRAVLGAGAVSLAGALAAEAVGQQRPSLFAPRAMPDFSGAVAWLNSAPISAQALAGRVALVQFWTFTCVNWQRTLPFVQAWSAKYRAQGLAVIGVHTPEFSFEHEVANVREAVAKLRIDFPVPVDSNMAIWNAFRNGAWPALYLVDAKGMVRYHHDGEGEYEATEGWLQRLLTEAGMKDVPGGQVRAEGQGSQAPADWGNLRSPETYTGYDKGERFASPGGMVPGTRRDYAMPARLSGNSWAAAGAWTFRGEAAHNEAAGARLAYRFHARDVNLVIGAARRERPVAFRVRIDGQAPGAAHGSDADAGGRGVFEERRLYQLVRQAGPIGDRDFELELLDPGAEVYAFTFG